MRRITSIFLLLIMLVTGAHPVLAMHFCEGELSSVNLINNMHDHSCCDKMAKMSDEDCDNKSRPHKSTSTSVSSVSDGCCHFEKVELSTDDFNYQQHQLNLNNIQLSFDNVWLTLYSVLNYLVPESLVTVQHIFPPGGLNKLNLDLLTYICTYRI